MGWYGSVWAGIDWYELVWVLGMEWYRLAQGKMGWYGWYRLIKGGMDCMDQYSGMDQYRAVWSGMGWYGLVWIGIERYGVVCPDQDLSGPLFRPPFTM